MNKSKSYSLLFAAVAIPVIIFFYFLNWRTNVIYGDDINIFMRFLNFDSFHDKINLDIAYGKFRPVHGLAIQILIDLFKKNLQYYYVFNIAVQSINTLIFACILNLFLRSPYLSLFFSLIAGLSRFNFFNVSQLLNGGVLEGLAMTFVLLALYPIVKALSSDDLTASQKQRMILSGILFANLSMYTHERYIVLFPFIILIVLLSPDLKSLTQWRRTGLCLLAVASIVLNVVIKKYFYSMPFFVGTGGTNISFSFSSAIHFLTEAVLSIFQINSGPSYLVGIPFSFLPVFDKFLVILVFSTVLLILIFYIVNIRRAFVLRQSNQYRNLFLLSFLSILFALFLMPAVVTIRLEQRWLQASFNVFILMLVIAYTSLPFKSVQIRNGLISLFVLLFLWTDYNYLHKGGDNLYMAYSEKTASAFKQAADQGLIHAKTEKLFIWEKQKDLNTENAINWDLGEGTIFEFYQGKGKKVSFVDFPASPFKDFDKNSDQILYIDNNGKIQDLTQDYLVDSLKIFLRDK